MSYRHLLGLALAIANNFCTRGHKCKLYIKSPGTRIRSEFSSECVITVWNELSVCTDFSPNTRLKVVF